MLAFRTLQPVVSLGADGPALARVLQQAGLGKASVVRVTGPAGLDAALWLCRHGFQRAAYVHANWVGTMRSIEALVVPHACASEELADLLKDDDCLRVGGVLIVQTDSSGIGASAEDVADLFEPRGYQVARMMADRGREVCIARRVGAPSYSKAA